MISVDHGRKPAVQYVMTSSLVDAEANLHRSFELRFFYIIFLRFYLLILSLSRVSMLMHTRSMLMHTQRDIVSWSVCPVIKEFCEAGGGAHLTKPGYWSKPHIHSNPTNLALFRHKITLYRFSQGRLIAGGSNGSRGLSPPTPTPSPLTLTTVSVYSSV